MPLPVDKSVKAIDWPSRSLLMFAKALSAVGGTGKRRRETISNKEEESPQKQREAAADISAESSTAEINCAPKKPRSLLTQALQSLGQEGRLVKTKSDDASSISSGVVSGSRVCIGGNSSSSSSRGSGGGNGNIGKRNAHNGSRARTKSLFGRVVQDLEFREEFVYDADKDSEKHIHHGAKESIPAEVRKLKVQHDSDISRRSVIISGFLGELEEKEKLRLLDSMLRGHKMKQRPIVHWITTKDAIIVYENEAEALRNLQRDSNILLRKSLLYIFEDNNFKHLDDSDNTEKLLELSSRRLPNLKDTVTNRVIKNSLGLKISLSQDVKSNC